MTTQRYSAQPGGVSVVRGLSEITIRLPDCDSLGDSLDRHSLLIDLDDPTARHLAQLLAAVTRSEDQELQDSLRSQPLYLQRTGSRPLQCWGYLVSQVSSQRPKATRWHNLALYRTDRGGLVLAIEYHSQWGEPTHYAAIDCPTEDSVDAVLSSWDWQSLVRGYPPGEAYARKNADLIRDLSARWQAAVSDLWKDAEKIQK